MCRGQQKGRRRGREKPPGKGGNPMRTQTFGIEMETTGLGRERTAKAIAAYFGTEAVHRARHLDDWRVPMPDGRHWTI